MTGRRAAQDAADLAWLRVLHGTADGIPDTIGLPTLPPTAPLTVPGQREAAPTDRAWLQTESIRGSRAHPSRARSAVTGTAGTAAAAAAGVLFGVALSEPFRALVAVLTDLARDLTGGA